MNAEADLLPPYFLKMLGNTQSIPCAFEFVWQKNSSLIISRRSHQRLYDSKLLRNHYIK